MSQEDTILRKPLDAVDRHKWQTISVVSFAIVFTPIAFLLLGQAFRSGDDIHRLLELSVVALIVWTSGLTVVVVLQLTLMTRRILRAIELAARREH